MHSPIWNNGKPGFSSCSGNENFVSAIDYMARFLGAFMQAVPDRLMGAFASGGPISMNVNTTDIKSGRRIMAAINLMTGALGCKAAAMAMMAPVPIKVFEKHAR